MAELEHLIKTYIPMSEASFLILSTLQHENHGYGIMQQVAQTTQQRVNLGASTVYTILYKMESDGLIEVVQEVDRRKVYRITSTGKKVLSAEAKRILQLAVIAAGIEEHTSNPVL